MASTRTLFLFSVV